VTTSPNTQNNMQKQILRIEASISGDKGISTQITRELSEALQNKYPDNALIVRNVITDAIPHFDASTIGHIKDGTAALADALIEEVQAADIIIIAAPMYNFSVPSQLTTWFDHIARAGVTFQYTSKGPVGLLKGKKVYVVSTRGGMHKGKASDVVTPYLNTILGFVGLDEDLKTIFVEGLNLSGDQPAQAIAQARQTIKTIQANKTTHPSTEKEAVS